MAPRIAGAMAITRYLGVNLAYLHILTLKNKEINIIPLNNSIKVYKIYSNYIKSDIKFKDVYCDLDDTLIINNKVNCNLISKLYKLKENHKIILITRHKYDVHETLNKFNICISLFDKIIHITDNTEKNYYMTNDDVLIDDSYQERKKCYDNNILAFDINMIDLL